MSGRRLGLLPWFWGGMLFGHGAKGAARCGAGGRRGMGGIGFLWEMAGFDVF